MSSVQIPTKCFLAVTISLTWLNALSGAESDLIEPLSRYVKPVVQDIDAVPQDRQAILDGAVEYIVARLQSEKDAELTFICTHNSRRSHLSQVWAQTAACYYGLDRVHTYSGGTAATACNIRTVRTLRRAGFSVVRSTIGDNPIYLVQYSEAAEPLPAYSKVYSVTGNPQQGFAAMMCCSDADEACPIVAGATARVALHYVDPKAADNTPQEAAAYDERCRQIATEMFCVMKRVKDKLGK